MKRILTLLAALSLTLGWVSGIQAKSIEERRVETTSLQTTSLNTTIQSTQTAIQDPSTEVMGVDPQYRPAQETWGVDPQYIRLNPGLIYMGVDPQY